MAGARQLPMVGSSPHRPATGLRPPSALQVGDYEVIERVYVSAEGTVYKVRHRSNGQLCALKQRYSSELGRHEDVWHEVNALEVANRVTEHVIQMIDAFEQPAKTVNIVLEWANGGDLSQLLAARRPPSGAPAPTLRRQVPAPSSTSAAQHLPEVVIWKWLSQIFRALASLNSRGIIHRDVKSSNVLLLTGDMTSRSATYVDGRALECMDAKLADLGVAKMSGMEMSEVAGRTFYGTPLYLAPEMIALQSSSHGGGRSMRGPGYGPAIDVWSAGVVAFEMAALVPPFDAADMPTLSASIMSGRVGPLPKHCSPELSDFIRLCLDPHPSSRITAADAASICVAQHGACTSRPVAAEASTERGGAPAPVPASNNVNSRPPTPPRVARPPPAAQDSSISGAASRSTAGIPASPLVSPPRVRPSTAGAPIHTVGKVASIYKTTRIHGVLADETMTFHPHPHHNQHVQVFEKEPDSGGSFPPKRDLTGIDHPRDGSLVARNKRQQAAANVEFVHVRTKLPPKEELIKLADKPPLPPSTYRSDATAGWMYRLASTAAPPPVTDHSPEPVRNTIEPAARRPPPMKASAPMEKVPVAVKFSPIRPFTAPSTQFMEAKQGEAGAAAMPVQTPQQRLLEIEIKRTKTMLANLEKLCADSCAAAGYDWVQLRETLAAAGPEFDSTRIHGVQTVLLEKWTAAVWKLEGLERKLASPPSP
jgi:serine/threonine protein kinase